MPDLLKRTKEFIRKEKLLPEGSRVLVGVSGGIDSMVLMDILYKLNYVVSIVHLNFGLRDAESDEDENLVREIALQHNVPAYIYKVDTKSQARSSGNSIQMEARDIRYARFEWEMQAHDIPFCALAHHQDDHAEFLFMSLMRGRGVDVLQGIPISRDRYIRPLWFASKEDIREYAMANSIKWREDRTNSQSDYLRNQIRNEIFPKISSVHPDPVAQISRKAKDYSVQQKMLREYIADKIKPGVGQKGHQKLLNLSSLSDFPLEYLEITARYWLEGEGLSGLEAEEASKLLESIPGKLFEGQAYKVTRTATGLAMIENSYWSQGTEKLVIHSQKELLEKGLFSLGHQQIVFNIETINAKEEAKAPKIWGQMNADSIKYPLTLRRWKQGDRMAPLGMGGKTKKLSDIFTSEKLSLFDKMEAIVFEDAVQIICLSGYRIADPMAIRPETKQILQITIQS